MPVPVEKAYSELWHYTTATGVYGILTNQQLWATNISYLNDADEFTGFFKRKLLEILKLGVRKGIQESLNDPEKKKYINSLGGEEAFEKEICDNLLSSIRKTSLQLQTYVTSFCSPVAQKSNDGLLSQWRGYGTDGGYAVVFDTQGLNKLLCEEQAEYFYSFGHWGDVDYFDSDKDAHEEVIEWESAIINAAESLVFENDEDMFLKKAEALFEPILALATRHKHGGFSEEAEIRISVITSKDDSLPDGFVDDNDHRKKKRIDFRIQNGMLVPYLSLFERADGKLSKLPIKKIVVGPHPDKLKRKKSIEKLLDQLDIKADVVMSEIPYLGA